MTQPCAPLWGWLVSRFFLDRDEAVVASPGFVWSEHVARGVLIVRVSGELDMSTWPELARRLRQLSGPGEIGGVVIDMSGVRFIDGHSAALITAAEATARTNGTLLRVHGLHDLPALVFDALGLDYLQVELAPRKGEDGGWERRSARERG